MKKTKKILSTIMILVIVTLQSTNFILGETQNSNNLKEIIQNNSTYSISTENIGETNIVNVIDSSSKTKLTVIYNKKTNSISTATTDLSNNKIINSSNNSDIAFSNTINNDATQPFILNKGNYEDKVRCLYGDGYWYQKGKKRKKYRIGCKATYTVDYAGNANRVKILDEYTNSIDKVNKYRNEALFQCGVAGVSYEVALLICAANAIFPEAVVVEAILAAAGIGDAGAIVAAVTKCVSNIFKMRKEYKTVYKSYDKAKAYAK
ncbi:hypothetical protein SAMN02745111_01042 [Eubacterium uniforme]|uniref:Uncharacterized protein n=1 Tax=Eubacterium uniforme TaxID=39495 RepID=A0A1T4VKT6_9FIRM|nr:hypothetical protein [Eubacterium uniforme]SKA65191.1 hypothetical protein SAMN02745111_01042 [Eubacterium uniforme]